MEAKLEMVCAAGLFHVMLLFLAFIGSILVIVFSAIKSTDVYEALDRAKADPAVIEALDFPIKDGLLVVEVRQTHQRIDLLQKSAPANSR